MTYVGKNAKFFDHFKIFDIGKVWSKKWDAINNNDLENTKETLENKDDYVANLVGERMQLGGIIYKDNISDWQQDSLLEAKALVKKFLRDADLPQEPEFTLTHLDNYHPKKQADVVVDGKVVGFIGTVHPLVTTSFKLAEKSSTTFVSLYLDVLGDLIQNTESESISMFETLQDQIVWRDLCFVVDEDKHFDDLLIAIKKLEEVQWIKIFDIYKGDNLPEGKKSLALSMKIVGSGNMKTEEINQVMDRAIKAGESVGAELRG